jgi:hypothetical protein
LRENGLVNAIKAIDQRRFPVRRAVNSVADAHFFALLIGRTTIKGRRIRASIALETKSHCDSRIPTAGLAKSGVSVSLGNQSWADAESDHRMTPTLSQRPRIERVTVEIGEVQMPEGDVEKDSLQGTVLLGC